MSVDTSQPDDSFLPTSGFTMLGEPEAAACVGDSCAVPARSES